MFSKNKKKILIFCSLLLSFLKMESFTIKYDMDDLCSATNVAPAPVSTDSSGSNEENAKPQQQQLTTPTNCICFRMARLFNDLLNTKQPSSQQQQHQTGCEHENANPVPNSHPTSTTNALNKPSTGTNDFSSSSSSSCAPTQVELKHIYKELKLVRKNQSDLVKNINYMFNNLQQQQQLNNQRSYQMQHNMVAGSAHKNSQLGPVANKFANANKGGYLSTANLNKQQITTVAHTRNPALGLNSGMAKDQTWVMQPKSSLLIKSALAWRTSSI